MVLIKEHKPETKEACVIYTVAGSLGFCYGFLHRRCNMKWDSQHVSQTIGGGRGEDHYMMHQVLPEKEVSLLGSASRISLLETGREPNSSQCWLTDWPTVWLCWCVRQKERKPRMKMEQVHMKGESKRVSVRRWDRNNTTKHPALP